MADKPRVDDADFAANPREFPHFSRPSGTPPHPSVSFPVDLFPQNVAKLRGMRASALPKSSIGPSFGLTDEICVAGAFRKLLLMVHWE
jgi:hypothetical protein